MFVHVIPLLKFVFLSVGNIGKSLRTVPMSFVRKLRRKNETDSTNHNRYCFRTMDFCMVVHEFILQSGLEKLVEI